MSNNSQSDDPCWEAAWRWVQRQHEAGVSDEAFNAELIQWLQADPANRRAYEEASRIWTLSGLVPPANDLPDSTDPTRSTDD
ncbi:FecR/PupR family sigma factor regulator [Thauera sinica]|uniref:FecR/PupR family sigma factor regulator n=1 Tax=Thauera sinica TaxID=2665146 RepID=A0ABW1ALV5_9RHOO|nr:DUF4880 domain-containing protein [Thauera sp. K11]ATE59254.1 DUF4880 domain-containing protein [Thauera sp. K11]